MELGFESEWKHARGVSDLLRQVEETAAALGTFSEQGARGRGVSDAAVNEKLEVMRVSGSWAQGWWDGFVEGIRLTSRTMCLDVVERHHAAVLSLVEPVIKACPCPFQLKEWAVVSSEISDEAFVTLVTGKPPVRAARSRASRPSRRATSSKRG